MVHLDQADTKFKYSHMTCRECVQLKLDANRIDVILENQIMNAPSEILVHLAALKKVIKPDISHLINKWGAYFQSAAQKLSRIDSYDISNNIY